MAWHERLGQVRAGGGQPGGRDRVVRRSRGDGVGERERQLVEELRVRRGQVEGNRVCLVAGDDPARQVAAAGRPLALARAGDAGVKPRPPAKVAEAEIPLDGAPEILWSYRRPGGVPDAGAQVKGVGPAAVGWGREGPREIRNEGVAGWPAGPAVSDQPVVGDAQHLPYRDRVGECRVGGLVMRRQVRDQRERAAAVACQRRKHRHKHIAARSRDSGGWLPTWIDRTEPVRGSIRATSPPARSATHTAPPA